MLVLAATALFAAMLAILPVKAKAAETYVSLPVASYHINHRTQPNGKPYNESQLGSGITFGQRFGPDWQLGYTLGTYENSYFRRSNFLAVEAGYRFNDVVRAGVLVGTINGYGGRNKGGYAILVAPQVEVKVYEHVSATFTFVPTTVKSGSNAIAAQLNWTF
jgi:hypothetical protein